MCISLFNKVNRVAAAFRVVSLLYLVKESDNIAIFPKESTGRFFSSSFTVGATFDVYGSDATGTSSNGGLSPVPFGSYT